MKIEHLLFDAWAPYEGQKCLPSEKFQYNSHASTTAETKITIERSIELHNREAGKTFFALEGSYFYVENGKRCKQFGYFYPEELIDISSKDEYDK